MDKDGDENREVQQYRLHDFPGILMPGVLRVELEELIPGSMPSWNCMSENSQKRMTFSVGESAAAEPGVAEWPNSPRSHLTFVEHLQLARHRVASKPHFMKNARGLSLLFRSSATPFARLKLSTKS